MDIFQIWMMHNPPWSQREIICFSAIMILTLVIVVICVGKKKCSCIQAVAIVLLVLFLGIVFGSTVFTRYASERKYELMPFWSWRRIWYDHDWELLKQNLLNCILLFPVGVLLPVIGKKRVKGYRSFLIGVLISALIEVSQLVFLRGLFEWDDMIHNGFGCMLGTLLMDFLFY